jgi:putative PEP-CTERM system integral membrane protein
MVKRAADVRTALEELDMASASGTTVDVYLTSSPYRGETPTQIAFAELEPDSVMYFGGQNAAELLSQFYALSADQRYDAIFVLTDDSGYELGAAEIEVSIPDAPVWMVHLGGDLPLGYDDATLEAIQASGGGVTGDIEETLNRLAIALEAKHGTSSPDVIDGYAWLAIPTEVVETSDTIEIHSASHGFAALAARRLILEKMRHQRAALGQLDVLDHLHAIAIEQGIVTPYSSMIVLVNNRQENRLDQLEMYDDRFLREHEEIGETTQQNPFSVTGVPEPEEWLLLALAAAMLLWFARTKVNRNLTHRLGD